MDKMEIGVCAQKVWQLLVDNCKWSYSDLKKRSGLRDKELGAALGWLAHENKVQFDQTCDELYVYTCINVYIG